MSRLTYTLLSDGASDRALLPVLDWVLRRQSNRDFQAQWADLRRLPRPPRDLSDRIVVSLSLYPCDLLFVHRDAEGLGYAKRAAEIERHLNARPSHPAVCVVPVRMQEAWLLCDEGALRRAAGNPQGRVNLRLPAPSRLESIVDPKNLLWDLLRTACELGPSRLRRFNPAERVYRLAELIEDFSPLRSLSAFRALESNVARVLKENSWL